MSPHFVNFEVLAIIRDDHIRDADGTFMPTAFDRRMEHELGTILEIFRMLQAKGCANEGRNGQGSREPHTIEAVVHRKTQAVHSNDLSP